MDEWIRREKIKRIEEVGERVHIENLPKSSSLRPFRPSTLFRAVVVRLE